jgi:hypothetical protein
VPGLLEVKAVEQLDGPAQRGGNEAYISHVPDVGDLRSPLPSKGLPTMRTLFFAT